MALKDIDAVERAQLLKIAVWFGPAVFIMLGGAWARLFAAGTIPGWLLAVLIVLDLPLIGLGILGIHVVTNRASTSLVHGLYAVGDIPPPKSYPRQDVMIVRGQYQEAADYFRDYLTAEPDDNEARLRLADLLEKHLNDVPGAERLYLEVRGKQPTRGEEMRAANGLIDLYRKQGNRERLLVELARFRDRYPGTPGASAAARLLTELKQQ
ncbi:MAG TPA: tetratricopeptide repeat protein [Gemmatimonadales bacterium]|nr:tetratricopeptide repeat protein [Gemmatimonadales bacterium]